MEDETMDFRLVCRTCLITDGEFHKLESSIVKEDGNESDDGNISLLQCLLYCTRIPKNLPEFPNHICQECSIALQVSYNFIRNAIESHRILHQKLIGTQRLNGVMLEDRLSPISSESSLSKSGKFRCKICNLKLETKKDLKNHIKFHMDIISFSCEICNFNCKKRNLLMEHYGTEHGVEATREQLMPKTNTIQTLDAGSTSSMMKTSVVEDTHEKILTMSTKPSSDLKAKENHTLAELPQQTQKKLLPKTIVVGSEYTEINSQTINTTEMLTNEQETQQQHHQQYITFSQEELIQQLGLATVITNNDGVAENVNEIVADGQVQQQLANHFSIPTEMSVGTEFIVLSDGTVEEVMGKGVVIEYIDAIVNNAAAPAAAVAAIGHDVVISNTTNNNNNNIVNGQNSTTNILLQNDEIFDGSVFQMEQTNVTINGNITTTTTTTTTQQTEITNVGSVTQVVKGGEGAGGGGGAPYVNTVNNASMFVNDVNMENLNMVQTAINIEDEIPASVVATTNNPTICKDCSKSFNSPEEVTKHMLTHKQKTALRCDHCQFSTSREYELLQHIKKNHSTQITATTSTTITTKSTQSKTNNNKLKSAENPRKIFSCDFCIFETRMKASLRRHYASKHFSEANDLQLKPTLEYSERSKRSNADFPDGIKCSECCRIFYFKSLLDDHTNAHLNDDSEIVSNKIAAISNHRNHSISTMEKKIQIQRNEEIESLRTANTINNIISSMTTNNDNCIKLDENQQQHQHQQETIAAQQQFVQFQEQEYATLILKQEEPTTSNPNYLLKTPTLEAIQTPIQILQQQQQVYHNEEIQQIEQHHQNGINNHQHQSQQQQLLNHQQHNQFPLDAVPQIVETDDIDFEFNNDGIFGDFDEDENDEDIKNLCLTSDDDFSDFLDENEMPDSTQMQLNNNNNSNHNHPTPQQQQEQHQQQQQQNEKSILPYCLQCKKHYYSQYQFENHMFVHRGLAPYRCELCTNIYNGKRALIRHYKAVHKVIPTRDMIQAKGEKNTTTMENGIMEQTTLEAQQFSIWMCAKCPYESIDKDDMLSHLAVNHGTTDENYMIQKLPFECPRCIRTFSNKARLLRHLERNHSLMPICMEGGIQQPQMLIPQTQQQQSQDIQPPQELLQQQQEQQIYELPQNDIIIQEEIVINSIPDAFGAELTIPNISEPTIVDINAIAVENNHCTSITNCGKT